MKKEIEFKTFDGTKLYMTLDETPYANGIVILVHGLCEYSGRYDYTAEKLNEAGYSVYRYDQRGHGRSEGPSTYAPEPLTLGNDVNAVFEFVKKENPNSRIFVMGHSMGGHSSALFGTMYPGKADGIVLLGAVTRQTKDEGTNNFPIPLPPMTYLPNEMTEGLCTDPKVVEDYAKDPLNKMEITVGILNNIYEATNFLRKEAKKFTDPVLVLHGCCDGLVNEKDSRDFYGDIASKDKTLHIYPQLCHELLNEPCKDDIIADVVKWLDRH